MIPRAPAQSRLFVPKRAGLSSFLASLWYRRPRVALARGQRGGALLRGVAPKALDKFKTQIRDMTRGISLQQLIEDLTPYLIGWRGYFGFCQTPRVLINLEAWLRRRLRSYLWREWQNGPHRFNELHRRGVSKFNAESPPASAKALLARPLGLPALGPLRSELMIW
jgi:Group II intron, maturase-specific domain